MNETLSPDSERSPVLKALRLLSLLAQCGRPMTLAELCRTLNLPKPTGFRLARALEGAGFVQKDPLTRRYLVGPSLEEIGLSALRHGSGHSSRRLMMNELAERLGGRVNLVVLKAGNLSFVEWVESTAPLRIDIGAGVPMPIHCSASGKLLLAHAPPELREHVFRAAPYEAYTKNTITTVRALTRELCTIGRQGYSEDDQELLPGVNCLAVPVHNRAGEVVAGLAVMAPAASLPLPRLRRHLPEIRACAARISEALGWHSFNSVCGAARVAEPRRGPKPTARGTRAAASQQTPR